MYKSSPPRTGGRLSPQGLFVSGQTGQPRLAGNLVFRLDDGRKALDGSLAAAKADEAAHTATLALEGRLGLPADGAGVLGGPGRGTGARGGGLVVEGGEGLELGVREEPKLEDVGRKVGVDGAGGELDERAQRQGHLAQLVGEGGIAGEQRTRLDGVSTAGPTHRGGHRV